MEILSGFVKFSKHKNKHSLSQNCSDETTQNQPITQNQTLKHKLKIKSTLTIIHNTLEIINCKSFHLFSFNLSLGFMMNTKIKIGDFWFSLHIGTIRTIKTQCRTIMLPVDIGFTWLKHVYEKLFSNQNPNFCLKITHVRSIIKLVLCIVNTY